MKSAIPLTIINVNRNRVESNHKHGKNDPVVRVSRGRYGRPRYGHRVIIKGPSEIVYRPKDPLPCGARVWIETGSKVVLL